MAGGGGARSMASGLLFLNLIMYVIVAIIAGWAINYSIDESYNSRKFFYHCEMYLCVLVLMGLFVRVVRAVQGVSPPVRLFPIYFPIGNLATGFFVIFSLIAAVVGVSTSLSGLRDVSEGYPASMMSAAASAIITWTLTLLAMGLACKEISVSWRPATHLEAFTIILTGTQLLCAGSLHAGAHAAILETPIGGRV
ncbi:hypothetical protein PR202_gb01066 [Eleusine coracana subsp. coracana]|uniref:Uncharacterized protein n=1 Tax=Eleusine coracana subsp. coracana TaxID=191504 RepID=A0AAV5DV95_ELECO|nr:hypothetical protein PR202_gb01066 [Eleusine coracana subsp. coracana]